MAKKTENSRSGMVVVTANRLRDGRVVWYAAPDHWVERIADGALFETAVGDAALTRAKEWEKREIVVDVYLVPVETGEGGAIPVTMRERVRAVGPSVRSGPAVSAAA